MATATVASASVRVALSVSRSQVRQRSRDAGHADRVITHALQLRRHVEEPEDLAKVSRHRALGDDEVVTQLMHVALQLVEPRVLLDHHGGEVEVERVGRR